MVIRARTPATYYFGNIIGLMTKIYHLGILFGKVILSPARYYYLHLFFSFGLKYWQV
jgi:hypothetical protein